VDREPLVYDFDLLVDSLKTARLIRDWVSQLEICFPVPVGFVKVLYEDRVWNSINLESGTDMIPVYLPDGIYEAYPTKCHAKTDDERRAFDLAAEAFLVIRLLERGSKVPDEWLSDVTNRFRLMLDGESPELN